MKGLTFAFFLLALSSDSGKRNLTVHGYNNRYIEHKIDSIQQQVINDTYILEAKLKIDTSQYAKN